MNEKKLAVLIVEDNEDDALLLIRELRRGGYEPDALRVETREEMQAALQERTWEVILSDYALPGFSGVEALEILQASGQDIPFLIQSGAIGEEAAVELMRAGAHDFIPKGKMLRLLPALERELGDVTARRQRREAEQELKEKERLITSTLDAMRLYIAVLDENGRVVYGNKAWYRRSRMVYNLKAKEVLGIDFVEFVQRRAGERQRKWSVALSHGIRNILEGDEETFSMELPFDNGDETMQWFRVEANRFADEGPLRVVVSYEDITSRKQMEEHLNYLSMYDMVTGFHNRLYFETVLQNYAQSHYAPVGILTCDIDGLKLVNDTLGIEVGDVLLMQTAELIRQVMPEDALMHRIGGNEFAVVFANTTREEVSHYARQLQQRLSWYNEHEAEEKSRGVSLSVSVGYALDGRGGEDGVLQCYKEAENHMYREKLHSGRSAKSAIVQTVMKLLEARDYITEGHADRMQEWAEAMGRSLGLAESRLMDLRLLAKFHDIGKVGIPDRILFKPGRLDDEEFFLMKEHPAIGHRIAQVAPDLHPIAESILRHHEWWDGSGYPIGLKGDEIPLECRILAIVDAYDAMRSDRPYRKALSEEAALQELRDYSGRQFDPMLVELFLRLKQKRK